MNRTKLLTIVVIGLLILNLGMLCMMFLNKQPNSFPPAHGPKGDGPKMVIIERLHFDELQQKQYQLLIDEHMDKTQELHKASRQMHDDIFSLLKEDNIDKQKTDTLVQQIADNQKAIELLNLDHFQKIKALCKPEQVKYFNDLAEDLGHLFAPKGPPGR
jgi:periplasmic protein CpxP/Spy